MGCQNEVFYITVRWNHKVCRLEASLGRIGVLLGDKEHVVVKEDVDTESVQSAIMANVQDDLAVVGQVQFSVVLHTAAQQVAIAAEDHEPRPALGP